MGAPMGGFIDGADVVPAFSAAALGVLVEATTFPTEPIPIDKGTHTRKVSEATPVPAETLTPREVATPPITIYTKAASPITPLVISTSDTFVVLSQAVNDGSSLVVTPSSIPSFATCGSDVDLSSEGSEDVLKDPDDEPVSKKRIFDSDKEENVPLEAKFMGMCLSPFLFLFCFCFCFCEVYSSPFLSSSSLHVCTCTSHFFAISLYLCAYFPAFVETFEGLGVAADVDMPQPLLLPHP